MRQQWLCAVSTNSSSSPEVSKMQGIALMCIMSVMAIGVRGADKLRLPAYIVTSVTSEDISSTHRPFIQTLATHLSVLVGKTVEFPCRVHNLGTLVLFWKRSKTKILFSGSIRVDQDKRFFLTSENSLRIYNVTPEYSGEYVCQVSTNPPIELHHILQVLVPPTIHGDPADGLKVVTKDESVRLSCTAEGDPNPVITWTAANGTLPRGITEKQGNTLTIASAESFHSGLYECKAENGVGEPAIHTFQVKVLYGPNISVSPTWVHAGQGSSVKVKCTVSAEPMAAIYWRHSNGSVLHSDDGHVFISSTPNSSTLQIKGITKELLGSYECYANNTVGNDRRKVEISGLAEPVIFKSDSIGKEKHSFFLIWSVKSYSPVIEYELRIRTLKDKESNITSGNWVRVVIPVETQQSVLHTQSYNITGLEPGSGYEVVLQARNGFGLNHPRDSFTFYTYGRDAQKRKEEITPNPTTLEPSHPEYSLEEEKIVLGEPEETLDDSTNGGSLKQTFPKCIVLVFIVSLSFPFL